MDYIVIKSKKRKNTIEFRVINNKVYVYTPLKVKDDYIHNLYLRYKEELLKKIKNTSKIKYLGKEYNLVNKKSNIVISTHSDTILEHINNMAVLHSMKDENKKNQILKNYSYTENDTIDIDKIRIYQFDTDDNDMTTIKELKGDRETGFYIETFHKYINKASLEYDVINNEDE